MTAYFLALLGYTSFLPGNWRMRCVAKKCYPRSKESLAAWEAGRLLARATIAIRPAETLGALISLIGRITLGRPIGVEVRGQQEDAQMREAHGVQGFESRSEIGAVRERTAAAVHHEIRGLGKSAGPFFQIIQTLRRRGRSVERRSGDVPALVKKMRSDACHGWLVAAGELLHQPRRIDRLGDCPRVRFWGQRCLRRRSRRRCQHTADGGVTGNGKEACGHRTGQQNYKRAK
jgi:hypothetical protein